MANRRIELGRRGEELAVRELTGRGYDVIERNWHCQVGEVDIVARQGEAWVFVEVRTRRGDAFGTPEESLTAAKQTRMVRVAQHYLIEHGLGDVDWRLDLVAVEVDHAGRPARLDVLENIVTGI